MHEKSHEKCCHAGMMIVGDCVRLSPTMETELLFYLCSCQGIIHVNTGSGTEPYVMKHWTCN